MRFPLLKICFWLSLAPAAEARDYRTAHLGMAASPGTQADAGNGQITARELDLTQPLPVHFLGGMVTLQASGSWEATIASGTQRAERSTSSLGLHYLHHAAEGVPQFRVEVQRLGSADEAKALPMVRTRMFVDGNDADQSWLVGPPGFRTRATVGLNSLQRGVETRELHPTADLQWEHKRRLLLEIAAEARPEIPGSLTVSYTGGQTRQWTGFATAGRELRYFVTTDANDPWVVTTEEKTALGFRHRIASDWFASLQVGTLKRDGLMAYNGPWGELAIQSWTAMP